MQALLHETAAAVAADKGIGMDHPFGLGAGSSLSSSRKTAARGGPSADAGAGVDDADDISQAEMDAFLKTVADNPEAAASMLQQLAMGDIALDKLSQVAGAVAASSSNNPNNESNKNSMNMMEVTPIPGMVIKTRLLKEHESWAVGLKVFINLCYSPDIPAPPTSDYEEVARALANGDNTTFKVPLSLAGPRPNKDKEGNVCLVFDACVNTAPYEMGVKDASFKNFLVLLCLEWLEEKHKFELDRVNVSFPKMKSKGPLVKHSVRKAPKSLITEMSKTMPNQHPSTTLTKNANNTQMNKDSITSSSAGSSSLLLPSYEVFAEPPDVPVPEFLVARIRLPKLATLEDSLVLDVEPRKLILSPASGSGGSSAKEKKQSPYRALEITLPHVVDIDQTGAQFDRSQRVLTVTMFVEEKDN